jgi:hypothetical protein
VEQGFFLWETLRKPPWWRALLKKWGRVVETLLEKVVER